MLVELPLDLSLGQVQRPLDRSLSIQIEQALDRSFLRPLVDLYYREWHDALGLDLSNATSVQVSERQYAWLYSIVSQASQLLDLETPLVFVVQDPVPDAFVANVNEPILVVNSGLVRLLSDEELLFVVSHELGHIKAGHLLTGEISTAVLSAAEELPGETLQRVAGDLVTFSALQLVRESELTADRFGFLLVADFEVCSSALIKLASGLTEEEAGRVDVSAFVEQRRPVEENAFLLRRYALLLAEARSPQPFIGTRVAELRAYAESSEYQALRRLPSRKIYINFRPRR
jgi:Zn-dependent protease with chaperone function